MLMALGRFPFSLSTIAHDELSRRTAWRHATSQRVGARDATQYVGPGEETIGFGGTAHAELTDGRASLDQLREMAGRDGDRHDYQVQKQEEATGVSADWHDRGSAKKKTVTAGRVEGARKLSRTYASEADARAAAKAEAGRAARQPRTLSLSLALGRPDLKPETPITVSGFKTAIDAQRWVLAEVTHTLGDRGFSTGLRLEST